jgi:hypothetical protein
MHSQSDWTLVAFIPGCAGAGSLLGAAGDCAVEVSVLSLLSKSELLAPDLYGLVADLAYFLKKNGWLLACAKSCTGGLIAAACTELAGVPSEMRRFEGDRRHVRQATVLHALERLLALVRPAAP